ncbi:hypothetical protein [Endozoicomonas sp. ALC020]
MKEKGMNLTVDLRSKTLLKTGHRKAVEEGHFKGELTSQPISYLVPGKG